MFSNKVWRTHFGNKITKKKASPYSNGVKSVMGNYNNIHFDVLEILNTRNKIYINSVIEELHIHNEIMKNHFNNISIASADQFKK